MFRSVCNYFKNSFSFEEITKEVSGFIKKVGYNPPQLHSSPSLDGAETTCLKLPQTCLGGRDGRSSVKREMLAVWLCLMPLMLSFPPRGPPTSLSDFPFRFVFWARLFPSRTLIFFVIISGHREQEKVTYWTKLTKIWFYFWCFLDSQGVFLNFKY